MKGKTITPGFNDAHVKLGRHPAGHHRSELMWNTKDPPGGSFDRDPDAPALRARG